jgi:hypothetical protein
MLWQNSLHPANKMRREAIESGRYCEIVTKEDADNFLKSSYRNLLELEITGEESRIIMLQKEVMSMNVSKMALLIKDVDTFAQLITGLKVGDGGVKSLINKMYESSSFSAYDKLKLIVSNKYEDKTIFGDVYTKGSTDIKFKSPTMYKLFIRYVVVDESMTQVQFQDVFPKVSDLRIEKWRANYRYNHKKNFINNSI